MNKKLLLTLVSSMFLGLASCSNGNENDPKQPKEPEPEYVPVFVMTGQSNMEGSTYWRYNGENLLKKYMTELGEDYSFVDPDETNNNVADKATREDGVENS